MGRSRVCWWSDRIGKHDEKHGFETSKTNAEDDERKPGNVKTTGQSNWNQRRAALQRSGHVLENGPKTNQHSVELHVEVAKREKCLGQSKCSLWRSLAQNVLAAFYGFVVHIVSEIL